ncbi:MAG: dTMP kinase [Candidatus Margulisiibacteriota bacterium]|jgi:dTMP kinase
MIKNGFFISFEGIDCSGKSTQLDLLYDYLKQQFDLLVIKTKEPGSTELGKELRHILLNSNYEFKSKFTESLLFTADRVEHVEQILKPNLEKKAIILCDRYIDSTLAYQIGGRNLPKEKIQMLNSFIDLKPNLTFLIDIDPESNSWQERFSEKAKTMGKDRFEKENIDFYKKVRHAYIEIAKNEPNRIIIIDGTKSIDIISAEIKNVILTYANSN